MSALEKEKKKVISMGEMDDTTYTNEWRPLNLITATRNKPE
jgi:hypothetical protein